MSEIPNNIYANAIEDMILDSQEKVQEYTKKSNEIKLEIAKKTIEKQCFEEGLEAEKKFEEAKEELEKELEKVNGNIKTQSKRISILSAKRKDYRQKNS